MLIEAEKSCHLTAVDMPLSNYANGRPYALATIARVARREDEVSADQGVDEAGTLPLPPVMFGLRIRSQPDISEVRCRLFFQKMRTQSICPDNQKRPRSV